MSSSNGRQRTTAKTLTPKDVTQSPDRAGSEVGGVQLPQNAGGGQDASKPGTASSKRRRRPKKIVNKEVDADEAVKVTAPHTSTNDVTVEVKALKSKVSEIEAQVQEILLRPASQGPTKTARRRTRNQKGASSGATSSLEDTADVQSNEALEAQSQATNELEKLQDELKGAQEELVALKAKDKKSVSTASEHVEKPKDNDDEVEDIPRTHDPGLMESQRPRPLGRAVTLSGSYRIPIPVSVSDADFDAISRGIRSAQTIARSFMDASAEGSRSGQRSAQSSNAPHDASSGSWSEWIGGYSMSIAKAVDKVRISSNLETVPHRPSMSSRSETAPPTRRKPQKLEMRGKKRPEMSGASRKLSDTQVAGLLA